VEEKERKDLPSTANESEANPETSSEQVTVVELGGGRACLEADQDRG
jgi:hypothetical protein